MKRLLVLTLMIICILTVSTYAGNVVIGGNNQAGTGTPEDTVTMGGYVLDSLGRVLVPDSFVVMVINPVGDSVYCDGLNTSDVEIHVRRGFTGVSSGRFYYATFTKSIADIDGVGTGREGTYTIFFTVIYKTASGSWTNGFDNTFVGSLSVNSTSLFLHDFHKVYYYNPTNTAVVDSVQYTRGSTVVAVERYFTTDYQKPDSSVGTRK